jgi:hypothetical protein
MTKVSLLILVLASACGSTNHPLSVDDGGMTAAGGSSSAAGGTGGAVAPGGSTGTGGVAGTGGSTGTGGRPGTPGVPPASGATGTGGTGGAGGAGGNPLDGILDGGLGGLLDSGLIGACPVNPAGQTCGGPGMPIGCLEDRGDAGRPSGCLCQGGRWLCPTNPGAPGDGGLPIGGTATTCPANAPGMPCSPLAATCRASGDGGTRVCACVLDHVAGGPAWRCL